MDKQTETVAVQEMLQDGSLDGFERAVEALRTQVDAAYRRKEESGGDPFKNQNPLGEMFHTENEAGLTRVPLLDAGLEKWKGRVSIHTLLNLVDISLRSVAFDNFKISITAIEEIISRGRDGLAAQLHVMEQFLGACQNYDSGHRPFAGSVLDRLYDELFPRFECEPLLRLLDEADGSTLTGEVGAHQAGDGADRLFVAAFRGCHDEALFRQLTDRFVGYRDECLVNMGYDEAYIEYFQELQSELANAVPAQWKDDFHREASQNGRMNDYAQRAATEG